MKISERVRNAITALKGEPVKTRELATVREQDGQVLTLPSGEKMNSSMAMGYAYRLAQDCEELKYQLKETQKELQEAQFKLRLLESNREETRSAGEDTILSTLSKDTPQGIPEIITKTGYTEKKVYRLVAKLKSEGKVKKDKVQKTKYILA